MDDPLLIVRGTSAQRSRTISLALLWVAVLGYPVAWHKSDIGTSVRWIGAHLSLDENEIVVSIPSDKLEDLAERTWHLCETPTASKKSVRSLCGGLAFVSGLVCFLRPFCSSLWAALSEKSEGCNDDAQRTSGEPTSRRKKRLPSHLVFTKRFKHSLLWLTAFFSRCIGPLERRFPLSLDNQAPCLHVSTDASPWGIGGVLVVNGEITSYFADHITELDLRRFNASVGVSDFNTIWEALAILVAVRTWRASIHCFAKFHVRSDSLSAIRALVKLSSSAPSINIIARELALDCAQLLQEPSVYEHTPGVANKLPDALSRLYAPVPSEIPAVLGNVRMAKLAVRDSSFWRTTKLPQGTSQPR